MVSQRPDIEPASDSVLPVTGCAFARPTPPVRLALALAASIAIVGGSPLAGVLRQALLTHWPAGYVPVLAACVALPAIGILAVSARIAMRAHVETPHWSTTRLTAIGLAFGLAIAVGYLERTGDPNVDVVEAFHFVEFGALTCLLVWAMAPLVPGHAWVWGAAASIVVGALDEWTQWFVPNRTGEIRDVSQPHELQRQADHRREARMDRRDLRHPAQGPNRAAAQQGSCPDAQGGKDAGWTGSRQVEGGCSCWAG